MRFVCLATLTAIALAGLLVAVVASPTSGPTLATHE